MVVGITRRWSNAYTPDYNKANIRRSTDAWVKAKDCPTEKYYNTNWDRPDPDEDPFMIALQKNG